jgi:hypothetical protein
MKNPALLSRKLSVIIFLLFVCSFQINSQAGTPKWKWAKTAGDAEVSYSETDTLGNTVVLGKFSTDNLVFGNTQVTGTTYGGSENLYVVKYNSVGRVMWAASIYGTDSTTLLKPTKLLVNNRGEIVIYGTVENTTELMIKGASILLESTNENIFIAKFFKTGRLLWARCINTIGGPLPVSIGTDAVMDEIGNVFITGYFSADSIFFGPYSLPGRTDTTIARMFLVKYLPNGMIEWARTNSSTFIGEGNIYGVFLEVDRLQNIYLAGAYNGNESFIIGLDTLVYRSGENVFLAKYNPAGDPEWAHDYANDLDELPDKLMIDKDDNVCLVGVYNSPTLDFKGPVVTNADVYYDVFIAKIDGGGVTAWVRSINTQMTSIKTMQGANTKTNIDINNNLYVVSEFMGSTVLYNEFMQTNAQPDSRDILIAKYNGITGDPEWATSGNSPGDNMFNSVIFDKTGNTYLTGNVNTDELVYVDTDATMVSFADNGYGGFYILKIDHTGDIRFSRSQVNATDNYISDNTISIDPFGNLYLAGKFAGPNTQLEDGIAITQPGDLGIFLAKLSYVSDISGMVVDDGGTPFTDGYVKLYGFTRFQLSPLSDSVIISNDGTYLFIDIPYGWYIIFAKPYENLYPNAAQTYYPSGSHWEEAERILVTSTDPITGRDIIVNDKVSRPGAGSLDGEIYESDTTDIFKSTKKIMKKAVKEVDVVLVGGTLKSDYEVIAITQTDESGAFAFYGIEDGEYGIIADIPGLPHDEIYWVIIQGGSFISNLDYLVGEEWIYKGEGGYTVIPGNAEKSSENIQICPNPAEDYLFIKLENIDYSQQLSYEIVNTAGELINTGIIPNPDAVNFIDVTSVPEGAFILKIYAGNDQYLKKLIIH